MKTHETLRAMQALRKTWRDQDFKLTPEQQKQYDTLLDIRRARVQELEADA